MIYIEKFVFSPFQENTYVLYNDEKECWIIDPGCYDVGEQQSLKSFINKNNLKPTKLINTHCHIDHVFGNAFVHRAYGLTPIYHPKEEVTLSMAKKSAEIYGLMSYEESPQAEIHFNHGDEIAIGNAKWEIRYTPGHAIGHVVMVNHLQKIVIGGDVLFRNSIGRTDLPGGNHAELLDSIRSQLYSLPDDYTVYAGHGPETSIGIEKNSNPFVRA